jgi:hypothetical protein
MMRWIAFSLVAIFTSTAFAQDAPPDPMRPPTPAEIEAWFGRGSSSPEREPFSLQAILLGPQRRIAIINGTRLRVGERIDDATVDSIEPGRVVVTRGGQRIELNIDTHLNHQYTESRD